MSEEKKSRGAMKWVLRTVIGILVLLLVVVAAAGIALATGIPQRTLITRVLGDTLKADVQVQDLSWFGQLKIGEILAKEKGAAPDAPPKLRMTGLDVDYDILPRDKRYIPSVQIGELSFHTVEKPKAETPVSAPEAPKTAADLMKKQTPKKKKGKGGLSDQFMPKTVNIGNVDVAVDKLSFGVALANFGIKSNYESGRKYDAEVKGDNISASWWVATPDTKREVAGSKLDVRVKKDGKDTVVEALNAQFPGVLESAISGSLKEGGDAPQIDVNIEKLVAQNLDFSQADPKSFPLPFKLDNLDLSGTRIKGSVNLKQFALNMADTKVNILGKGLSLGKDGAFYEGPLTITGGSTAADVLDLSLQALLNQGQALNLTLAGKLNDLNANLSLDNWSKDQTLAAIPKGFRPVLEGWPQFQGLASASLNANLKLLTLDTLLTVQPKLADSSGQIETAELKAGVKGSPLAPSSQMFEVSTSAQVGDGALSFGGRVGKPQGIDGTFTIENVDPELWARMLAGSSALAGLKTNVAGTVGVKAGPKFDSADVTMDLTAKAPQYSLFSVPEGEDLKLTGNVKGTKALAWKYSSPQLEVRLGTIAALILKDFEWDSAAHGLKADITTELDLAKLQNMAPVQGRIKLHAPVANEGGRTTATVDGSFEGLGVAEFVAPVTPITLKGAVSYDSATKSGGGTDLVLACGSGTSFTSPSWKASAKPASLELPYTFETDFLPLIEMGLFKDAKGKASFSGTMNLVEGKPAGSMNADIQAELIALEAAGTTLNGLSAKGSFGGGAGYAGSGDLTLAKLVVMGVPLQDIKGPFQMENGVLKSAALEGLCCEGTVAATASAGLLVNGMPLDITAQFKGVNLASLIREMGLPSIQIAGLADGDLTVKAGAEGLRDFRLNLTSTQGLEVSRVLIDQLLTSQYAQDPKIKLMVDKMFGKETVLPFDSGTLTLGLEEGRIAGKAVFTKDQRTFNIDLKVDMAAITESMSMVKESAAQAPQS